MLTTQPSNSPSYKPANVPTCKRENVHKRGAPPGNTNALKHGAWSSRGLTPLSTLSCTTASLRQQYRSFPADSAPGLIEPTRVVLSQISDLVEYEKSFEVSLQATIQFSRTIPLLGKLRDRQFLLDRDPCDLQTIAPVAIDVIRVDFHDHGITRDADSFRDSSQKSDFNSAHRSPSGLKHDPLTINHAPASTFDIRPLTFLTNDQWAVIEPLLPSPNVSFHLGRGRGWGRRGRPPTDPRRLLDAIFMKLASACRWEDLPPSCPPMLTCRRYYRRLFLSGRLATLYKALFKHLQEQGVSLPKLVEKGCFTFRDNRKLTLRPGIPAAWQNRTALLILQLALQVLRRRRREYYRQRSLNLPPRTDAAYLKRKADMDRCMAVYRRENSLLLDAPHFEPLQFTFSRKKISARSAHASFSPDHPHLEPLNLSSLGSPLTTIPRTLAASSMVSSTNQQSALDFQPLTFDPLPDLFLNSSKKSDFNSSHSFPLDRPRLEPLKFSSLGASQPPPPPASPVDATANHQSAINNPQSSAANAQSTSSRLHQLPNNKTT